MALRVQHVRGFSYTQHFVRASAARTAYIVVDPLHRQALTSQKVAARKQVRHVGQRAGQFCQPVALLIRAEVLHRDQRVGDRDMGQAVASRSAAAVSSAVSRTVCNSLHLLLSQAILIAYCHRDQLQCQHHLCACEIHLALFPGLPTCTANVAANHTGLPVSLQTVSRVAKSACTTWQAPL